jgi:hypothetical protein
LAKTAHSIMSRYDVNADVIPKLDAIGASLAASAAEAAIAKSGAGA